MPLTSIIIPTRNRCESLLRAIESARRAASNVEIVVVDDASEDQTPDVCRGLAAVRYIRVARRLGVGGARNVGIIASTSEYISFLDDDDLRLPGTIDAQISLLADRPEAGMVYGRTLYGDQECQPKGGFYPDECPQGDVFWQLLRSNFVPCATVVFRRTCLLRVGMLDEAAPGIEDWDLWIRIAELYPVLALEQPVAIWRQPTPTSTQFTSRPDRLHRQMYRLHREKWSRLPRVQAARLARRRRAARDFKDSSAQQLTWELLRRLRGGQTASSAKVALALATMYPLTAPRKLFQSIIRKRFPR